MERKPTRDPEDFTSTLGFVVLALVVGALLALLKADEVAAVVGVVLRLIGAIGPAASEPSAGACRVIAMGGLLLVASALLVAYKIIGWALDRAELRPWASGPPGPRAWIAAAACLGLCAALGLGLTALFQGASGLPIHLSWRAALAGGPFAILVGLGGFLLLAS